MYPFFSFYFYDSDLSWPNGLHLYYYYYYHYYYFKVDRYAILLDSGHMFYSVSVYGLDMVSSKRYAVICTQSSNSYTAILVSIMIQ